MTSLHLGSYISNWEERRFPSTKYIYLCNILLYSNLGYLRRDSIYVIMSTVNTLVCVSVVKHYSFPFSYSFDSEWQPKIEMASKMYLIVKEKIIWRVWRWFLSWCQIAVCCEPEIYLYTISQVILESTTYFPKHNK